MWLIILGLFTVILALTNLFIINRYNQLLDVHLDLSENTEDLMSRFTEYSELLDTVEQSDILIFDSLINRLVEEGKDLNEHIERVRGATQVVIEEKE